MTRIVTAVVFLLLALCGQAAAQSTCPSITSGAVLTAGQWNSCFSAKQDVLGFSPLNKAGDTQTGPVIAGGTAPGISGCSATGLVGGADAGRYTSGTTGTCTVTLTFVVTAPNGWVCDAHDITTPANAQNQSASTTTTATISGTTGTGDSVNFNCRAF